MSSTKIVQSFGIVLSMSERGIRLAFFVPTLQVAQRAEQMGLCTLSSVHDISL